MSYSVRLDQVAAVAYSVIAVPLILNEAATVQGGAVAFAGLALIGSAIAGRRRRPVPSLVLCLAGLGLLAVAVPRASVVGFGGLVAVVYTVAASVTARLAVAALAVVSAAAAATALPRAEHLGAAGAFGTALTISWALGFAVGAHRRTVAHELREQRLQAEAEIDRTRAAATAQRLQLARELHDAIAHGLSVVTVQAGYGGLIVRDDAAAAADAFAAIEATGRDALNELRRLVNVLRADGTPGVAPPAELAPAPGLADIHRLADDATRAGLRVELDVIGTPGRLSGGVELTAYRVVQEALTNVRRHAGTDRVRVAIRHDPDHLEVVVADDGRGAGEPAREGHGLVGMRERVELYGGTFRARSRAPGFEVSATIPTGARLPVTASPGAASPESLRA